MSKKEIKEQFGANNPNRVINGSRNHEKGFTFKLVFEGTKVTNKRPQ